MCHMAANNLLQGKNVLYITLEMADWKISQRIDANLLGVDLNDIKNMSKKEFTSGINKIKGKTAGKLIVKEYPPTSVGVGHFRHLLNELRLKKDFVPDVIYVDYINICLSERLKANYSHGSYQYLKFVAEELRALAVVNSLPLISCTQFNRSGSTDSDPELDDISESFAIAMTVDFMAAIVNTEELEQLNQLLIKQLKNRYGDKSANKRFIVGVDRAKMRLYDINEDFLTENKKADASPVPGLTNKSKRTLWEDT